MGRDVPWEKDNVCDECGKSGAYDFMGDYFCQECADRLSEHRPVVRTTNTKTE